MAACGYQPARQALSNSNAEPTAAPSARTTHTVEHGEVIYDAALPSRTSPVSGWFWKNGPVIALTKCQGASSSVWLLPVPSPTTRLILADEATGELDSETTHEILALFRTIIAGESITMLLATRDNLVDDYVDKVL